MQTTYHYFRGSSYLGSAKVDCACCYVDCYDRGACRGPSNIALCCPHCGDVWARVTADGEHRWSFQERYCPKCPAVDIFGRPIPSGTFGHYIKWTKMYLPRWDWGLAIEHLPLPVLLWDFNRELDFYDRERSQDGAT